MKHRNKIYDQRAHAKRRALERYGLTLNRHELEEMNAKARRAQVLERQSQRVTVRAIQVGPVYIPVVYDQVRGTIVTFLPKEAFAEEISKLNSKLHGDKGVSLTSLSPTFE